MARPVYSYRFIAYTSAEAEESFEVPAGFVAVVRDFTHYGATDEEECTLYVLPNGYSRNVYIAQLVTSSEELSQQWTGRVVCDPGDIIGIATGDLNADSTVYVGGYLLTQS